MFSNLPELTATSNGADGDIYDEVGGNVACSSCQAGIENSIKGGSLFTGALAAKFWRMNGYSRKNGIEIFRPVLPVDPVQESWLDGR